MHPPNDDYDVHIDTAVRAIVEHGRNAGAEALAPIAYPTREVMRRAAVPPPQATRIYRRDRFCCRYCGRRTVLTQVMALLGTLYPESFPYHPNWKGGVTHPAVLTRSPVIDHVDPGAWGGGWTEDENMVTACWPCNASKADLTLEQLGWPGLRPIPDTDWDGLTSMYRRLWVAAGRPATDAHPRWLAALGA